MSFYYCTYCGHHTNVLETLTNGACSKNPDGQHHVPYEGIEKDNYTCKYCGHYTNGGIEGLTNSSCDKSPSKYHIPSIR